MSLNLLAKFKNYLSARRKKKEISNLEQELDSLKIKDYKPRTTSNEGLEEVEKSMHVVLASTSDEYEFDDMYKDPVRAIKVLRRIIELKYDCPSSPITQKQKRMIAERQEQYRKFK